MPRLLAIFLLLLSCRVGHAFPELVKRGYGNCITCHFSPTGGGILTEYGRSVINEVLTTAGTDSESKFLYNAFTLPSWLAGGGDLRTLGAYYSVNGTSSTKVVFPMQADVEAAASVSGFTFDATGGVDFDLSPISRRHFVLYHATDELTVRAGRFMPAYGINTEDHALAIKRGVGKDQSTETYNFEAAWIDENFDAFLTAIAGRPDSPSLGVEQGFAASTSVYFAQRFKTGLSYYYGYRDIEHRQLAGPFAILGITSHIVLLAEVDFQWSSAQGMSAQTGAVDDIKLDFEVIQGLHFYLLQEFSKLDFSNPATFSDAYGVGAQFFPRPHLEVNSLFQLQRFGNASGFGEFAWIMLHFYL